MTKQLLVIITVVIAIGLSACVAPKRTFTVDTKDQLRHILTVNGVCGDGTINDYFVEQGRRICGGNYVLIGNLQKNERMSGGMMTGECYVPILVGTIECEARK